MIKATRRVHALTWIVFIVALSMAVATFGSLTYAQQMGHAPGEDSDEQHLATITFVSGTVGVWHEGAAKWTMVETPYELYMGDHVRTGADARAVIVFTDESELLMHEQTTVQITPREPVEAPRGVAARVKVSLGKIFNRVTPGQSDLEFETPDAVAAVRGTQFLVTTGPDGQTQLVVLAGMVDAMLDRTLTDEEMVDFLGGYLDLEGATDADALEAWLHALMDDLIAEVEESTRGTSEDIRERIAPPRDDGEAARAQALEDREQERRDELRQRDRERQQQRREELLQRLQQRQQERAEEQQQQRAEEQQRRREERQHMRDRIEQRAGDRTEERTAAETQSPDTELPPGDVPDEGGVGDHLTRVDFAEIVARLMEVEGVREDGTSPALDWATEFIERQVDSGAADEFGSNSPGPWTFEELAQLVADLGLDAETVVQVLSGQVDVFNELGLIAVGAGQRTQVAADEAPSEAAEMSDEELMAATEWVEELDDQREAAAAITDGSDDEDESDESPSEDTDVLAPLIPGGTARATVGGRIIYGSQPAPRVDVTLWSSDPVTEQLTLVGQTQTDEHGDYTFGAPPGEYRVGLTIDDLDKSLLGNKPVIGDIHSWRSPRVIVEDAYVDAGRFDLMVAYDVMFPMDVNFSEWGTPQGGPLAVIFDGGAGSGADTLFIHPKDVIMADNPVRIAWTLDSEMSEYLRGAVAEELQVFTATSPATPTGAGQMHPREDGASLLSLSERALRLVLKVSLPTGESMSIFGPKVVTSDFPTVQRLGSTRLTQERGSDLEVDLFGTDLHIVTAIEIWGGGDDVGDSVAVEPVSSSEAKITAPWSIIEGPGLYTFVLKVQDREFHQSDHRLLITSTDLSGDGPGVALQRGDLHRSGRGDGPVGDGDLKAEHWKEISGYEDWWGSGPFFLGDSMVVDMGGHIDTLSLLGDAVASHQLNQSYEFTMAGASTQGHFLYYMADGGLASFVPQDPQADVIHDETGAYYDNLLVHDGVLVAVNRETLVTYDARTPQTMFRETSIDLPPGEWPYQLAISIDATKNDTPLIHVIGDGTIWTGELYTLNERWRFPREPHSDPEFTMVTDFAVSPGGDVLYIAETPDLRSLTVHAYNARTGEQLRSEQVHNSFVEGRFEPISDSLTVHSDGRLFALAVGTRDESSNFAVHGLVFGPVLQSLTLIEGPEVQQQEMPDLHAPGGLVLTDTGHAYGFLERSRIVDMEWVAETMLFRINTDPELLRYSPADAWETLDFTEIEGKIRALTVGRGFVWVIDEWGLIYRIGSDADFNEHGLPDPPLVKRADKANAQIGDVITYTITFDNTRLVDDETELVDHTNVWIQDVLPPGFVFVEGSSYVYPPGGAAPVALAPADSPKGRTLQFELTAADAGGTIPANTTRTLTYQAIVGPRVVEGATYSNTAIGYFDGNGTGVLEPDNLCAAAAPEDPVQDLPGTLPSDCDVILTNVARADVRVRPGVFTMRSLVVGKVFYDYDGDGMQSPGEPGISGARIVMETGVSVVTDPFGKFSLSNLTPGLHVFMLDETSLPGSESSVTDILGGNHRLIDLAGGGLFTVNFAVQAQLPEDESVAEVE